MGRLFVSIYDFFASRRRLLVFVFVACFALIGFLASRITIEEDISKLFPNDKQVEKFNYIFQNSKLSERIVVMVSMKDTSQSAAPDSLVQFADTLTERLNAKWNSHIAKLQGRMNTERIMDVFNATIDYLPVFLEESDYLHLDSITQPEAARAELENSYRQLFSPVGIMTKQVIIKDPLGFSFLVLKKLQQLQLDDNYKLYDDYVITKDEKCLLLFIESKFKNSDTGNNSVLVDGLRNELASLNNGSEIVSASAFGGAMVAVDNAKQLRDDSILTMSLMLLLIVIFIFGYFRKKRAPLLIIVPVIFGAVFALAMMFLIKSSVSILAIACGSIILGIAVNYSLHFLSHLKHTHDVRQCILDLANPMTLGSATTVLAFFSLQFANASILRDLGLFAGFSLIGAALCALVFLPHALSSRLFPKEQQKHSWIDSLASSFGRNKVLLLCIVLITPVLAWFSGNVGFNKDLSNLNFMEHETAVAQKRLEELNKSSLSSVYLVSEGVNMESALRENERVTAMLDDLEKGNTQLKYSGVSGFMISDSLQQVRLKRWDIFRKNAVERGVIDLIKKECERLKFSPVVSDNFNVLLTKQFGLVDVVTASLIRDTFYDQFIIEKDSRVSLITLANASPEGKTAIYNAAKTQEITAFDRQMVTNLFMDFVNADFSFIVLVTAIIVFVSLLLVYGRIELTLLTFIPMFLTWIWILGVMAIVGIEFNFVNVIVSTFIFGLGDDYSIFTMDGLLQEYRFKRKHIESTRVSVILSVLTTISGLGVLVFAKHPAMRSIAFISIIGILCVFVMSQVLVPFLFRWLVTNRTERKLAPMTLLGVIRTTYTYSIFAAGAVFLTVVGFIIKRIPFAKRQTKLFYHQLIRLATKATIYSDPLLKKNIVNIDKEVFKQPSVIIANHSSFLDILLTAMLHPKLILMTNKWVWNSPVFGGVVRLADYFPASEGAENGIQKLAKVVEDGYSIVIFPEGTRSRDGKIGRFHKGAFYLAEYLKLPIVPVLIHGAGQAVPKSSFYLNKIPLSIKMLPAILTNDSEFGLTYQERTKSVSRYFKQEYRLFQEQLETGRFFEYQLNSNYLYKGPVLEWYLKVKLRLEDFYESFHQLVPDNAKVLDLGCGYGFLSHMLHFRSENREIVGVDYDENKIETAANCYSNDERIKFVQSDVASFELETYDAIIIADVLHYLSREEQDKLLIRCFGALNVGGKLIVRDGDEMLKKRHRGTRLTEFFSVKLMRFNKAQNDLTFISGHHLQQLAEANNMKIQKVDSTKYTSNVVFLFEKENAK